MNEEKLLENNKKALRIALVSFVIALLVNYLAVSQGKKIDKTKKRYEDVLPNYHYVFQEVDALYPRIK